MRRVLLVSLLSIPTALPACQCLLTLSACHEVAVADRVEALGALAGFTLSRGEGYPGWQPDLESPLAQRVSAVHETLFGQPMVFRATHGGLECGLIGEGHPGLRMVSFGPDMWDIHTPDERVSISSVAQFWTLLAGVLESLAPVPSTGA